MLIFGIGIIVGWWKFNTTVLHLDHMEKQDLINKHKEAMDIMRHNMGVEVEKARNDAIVVGMRMQALQNILVAQHENYIDRLDSVEEAIRGKRKKKRIKE